MLPRARERTSPVSAARAHRRGRTEGAGRTGKGGRGQAHGRRSVRVAACGARGIGARRVIATSPGLPPLFPSFIQSLPPPPSSLYDSRAAAAAPSAHLPPSQNSMRTQRLSPRSQTPRYRTMLGCEKSSSARSCARRRRRRPWEKGG